MDDSGDGMRKQKRCTRNCVAYGCNNVANAAAKQAGNPINGGPKFWYHVKHSAKPDTNHSTNPTNPTTKYRV